jgi:hypothetical protein
VLRVTAVSNIYISAMNFGGAPDKLLDMAHNGDIVLAISDPIVAEATHVLRDKFGWTDEAIKLAQIRIADFHEKSPSAASDRCCEGRPVRQPNSRVVQRLEGLRLSSREMHIS